jgi:hypothetical protein
VLAARFCARRHVGDVAIVRDCAQPDLRTRQDYDPGRCDADGRCTFLVTFAKVGILRFERALVVRRICGLSPERARGEGEGGG